MKKNVLSIMEIIINLTLIGLMLMGIIVLKIADGLITKHNKEIEEIIVIYFIMGKENAYLNGVSV